MGESSAPLFLGSLPALIVPVIVGPCILIFLRGRKYAGLAGAYTLKPMIVAPLWLLGMALLENSDPGVDRKTLSALGLVPALGLTLVILLVFRHLYWPFSVLPYAFLLGDLIRLSNSILYMVTRSGGEIFAAWAYIVPSTYALLALLIVALQPRAAAPSPAPA